MIELMIEWCAGSLEGVISSFQDYSQIDIDSCCTRIRICSNSIYWIDEWWYPHFYWDHIKGGLGGNVSLIFYSQENEEDTFVFLLWKTWYEFSLRFHRFQILQWAIAPGTTCLWIKDFEGNHENIHFIACCMKYLLYLSSVSKFNFLWHNGHKRPSTFYQILAKRTLYSKLKRIPPIWAISKMANRIQWDWRPPGPINLFIFETTTSFFKYREVSQVWNEIYEVVFFSFSCPKKSKLSKPMVLKIFPEL